MLFSSYECFFSTFFNRSLSRSLVLSMASLAIEVLLELLCFSISSSSAFHSLRDALCGVLLTKNSRMYFAHNTNLLSLSKNSRKGGKIE